MENLDKETFTKLIENMIKTYTPHKNPALLEDLDYAIIFASVYLGNNSVMFEKNKEDTIYKLTGYEKDCSFKLSITKNHMTFERKSKNNSLFYTSSYDFSVPDFITRTSMQKSFPLDKEQIYSEILYSNKKDGIFYCETKEQTENWEVVIFKLPETENKHKIYYHFKYKEGIHMRRARSIIQEVPYLEINGITTLADVLDHHFDEKTDMAEIEDEKIFKNLIKASKEYYNDTVRMQEFINNENEIKLASSKRKISAKIKDKSSDKDHS